MSFRGIQLQDASVELGSTLLLYKRKNSYKVNEIQDMPELAFYYFTSLFFINKNLFLHGMAVA